MGASMRPGRCTAAAAVLSTRRRPPLGPDMPCRAASALRASRCRPTASRSRLASMLQRAAAAMRAAERAAASRSVSVCSTSSSGTPAAGERGALLGRQARGCTACWPRAGTSAARTRRLEPREPWGRRQGPERRRHHFRRRALVPRLDAQRGCRPPATGGRRRPPQPRRRSCSVKREAAAGERTGRLGADAAQHGCTQACRPCAAGRGGRRAEGRPVAGHPVG